MSNNRWSVPDDFPAKYRDRIPNALKQYNDKFRNRQDLVGAFYMSDIYGVLECSKEDVYDVIGNALEAGFIVGYRRGKKESQHKIAEEQRA